MTFEIERWFWDNIPTLDEAQTDPIRPRHIIELMMKKGTIRSEKQAWATLEKWSGKGWYDSGVTIDLGWKMLAGPFPRVPQIPRLGRLLAPEDA